MFKHIHNSLILFTSLAFFTLQSCNNKCDNCPINNITLLYENNNRFTSSPDVMVDSLKYLFYILNSGTDLILVKEPLHEEIVSPLESCVLFEGSESFLDTLNNNGLVVKYYFGFWKNQDHLYLNQISHLGVFKYFYDTALCYSQLGLNGRDFYDSNWKFSIQKMDSIFKKNIIQKKYNLNPWLKNQLDKRNIPYKKSFLGLF